MANHDLLSWTLAALALGLGTLYFVESHQDQTLLEAEQTARRHSPDRCQAHATGPGGKTLLLICLDAQMPESLPEGFENVALRGPHQQTRCRLENQRPVACQTQPAPTIRAGAPTHN